MRKIQSLTALRAFEAVARLRSISAAAAELNVTRPAVSKQLTLLEQALDVALLTRTGNAIHLTPAGEDLVGSLRQAFDIISAGLEAVSTRGKQGNRLRVLVCRDFASSWLAGRVGRFLVENPGVALEVIAEKNGNFRLDEDFDFRIFYGMAGANKIPGFRETELCRWIDLPVCTQGFAHRHLGPGKRACEAPCLIDANYDIWDEWCALTCFDAGGPRSHTTLFNETTLCLSVATSGGGLTIGDSFLALPAITAGDLMVPYPLGLLSAQSYLLYTPAQRKPSAPARKFGAWLKAAVEDYQSSVRQILGDRGIRIIARP